MMSMTKDEVIEIATVAGAAAAKAVINEVLTLLGMDVDHPLEMQKQMTHLRFWTNVWEISATATVKASVFVGIGIGIGVVLVTQFHLIPIR